MIHPSVFPILLLGSCAYALLKGTRDAQVVALVTLGATLATYFLVSRYAAVETGVLVVDMLVLLAFVAVALQSDRFWPLWIAGLHLTTTFGHALRAIDDQMVPIAYAVSMRFWSYPIHIILIVAVWRSQRRKQLESASISA